MSFKIIRDDITRVRSDAIVNTANPEAAYGRGTDSAIYKAAGLRRLLRARRRIGNIAPGTAAVTPAFALNAKYIIHTVGPEWYGGTKDELSVLASCYRESLLLAESLGCKSIAFPLISTGNYGFPKDRALDIALQEISQFSSASDMDVTLVVFDRTSFDLSSDLVQDITQFIDDNYVGQQLRREYRDHGIYKAPKAGSSAVFPQNRQLPEEAEESETTEGSFGAYFNEQYDVLIEGSYDDMSEEPYEASYSAPPSPQFSGRQTGQLSLDEVMKGLGQTFQEKLLTLIDEKGYTDTQVYKKANIDRKLFSKIRCNQNYKPSKPTALALAIALRLNLDDTVDLLGRAGLALSPSSKSDVIVKYCILNNIYDIYEVNAILFKYDQQLLC